MEQDTSASQIDQAASPALVLPKQGRSWRRYLVYLLAVLGLLFVGLAGFVAYSIWKDNQAPIPETATIESTMNANFGRYSEEHKGWLYVTDDKHSYVVRVVQQASIDNKRQGDGLYFVASGTPLDDRPGNLYGVFHLYKDAKNGELQQAAAIYRSDSDLPLSPEHVRFEALSQQVWAWVVKEHSTVDDMGAVATVTNVVLAPHMGEIKELARFPAEQKMTPSGGCAKAEEAYAQWLKRRERPTAPAHAAETASAASGAEGEVEGAEDETDYDEPLRCDDLKWTYKTNPPKDGVLTPLQVTRGGITQGLAQAEKSWKLMFDPKSYVYLVPDELK